MPYLIDGHNLIPKLAGFSLSAMDDEMQLIPLLQTFSRVRRQPVEVYFDRAPAGHAGVRRFGTITAHFVPSSRTADDAIRERLARLGADARNWRVVSSDRQVQAEARSRHAGVLSSEEFSRQLQLAAEEAQHSPQGQPAPSDQEIEEWLRLFGGENGPSQPDKK
jgi:predicted RNA-binding protein with PIN domain